MDNYQFLEGLNICEWGYDEIRAVAEGYCIEKVDDPYQLLSMLIDVDCYMNERLSHTMKASPSPKSASMIASEDIFYSHMETLSCNWELYNTCMGRSEFERVFFLSDYFENILTTFRMIEHNHPQVCSQLYPLVLFHLLDSVHHTTDIRRACLAVCTEASQYILEALSGYHRSLYLYSILRGNASDFLEDSQNNGTAIIKSLYNCLSNDYYSYQSWENILSDAGYELPTINGRNKFENKSQYAVESFYTLMAKANIRKNLAFNKNQRPARTMQTEEPYSVLFGESLKALQDFINNADSSDLGFPHYDKALTMYAINNATQWLAITQIDADMFLLPLYNRRLLYGSIYFNRFLRSPQGDPLADDIDDFRYLFSILTMNELKKEYHQRYPDGPTKELIDFASKLNNEIYNNFVNLPREHFFLPTNKDMDKEERRMNPNMSLFVTLCSSFTYDILPHLISKYKNENTTCYDHTSNSLSFL